MDKLNLVLFTRRVDMYDDRAGFMHQWIEKLAKRVTTLRVLCIEKGMYDLPRNVEVVYLGKNKISRFINFIRKNGIKDADAVFCHQNPIYAILCGRLTKKHNKPLIFWYAHGTVSNKLLKAIDYSDKVLTSTPEGCNVNTPKKVIIGQGIDTNKFKPTNYENKEPQLLTVGRISPVKGLHEILPTKYKTIVIGESTDDDYYCKLVEKCGKKVKWIGAKPHDETIKYYQNCDVFISNSRTGSLDKSILEAMSCGKPILVYNKATKNILSKYAEQLTFEGKDDFDNKLEALLNLPKETRDKIGKDLRQIVVKDHNLDDFMDRLTQEIFEIL